MSRPVLKAEADGRLTFWCPACRDSHTVAAGDGSGPRWKWNGRTDLPTFEPSVLVRAGHYTDRGHQACWCTFYKENPPKPGERVFKCYRCHSFVTDGKIHFLSDCSHDMKGQTVPIPAWEEPVQHHPV